MTVLPHMALIQRAYKDFDSGDLDLLRNVMADDVVWHQPGRSDLSGDYKGPEAILEYLAELKARSGGTLVVEPLDVLGDPERMVVFQREMATRNQRIFDMIVVMEMEIHNGKITEVNVYHSDTYSWDEFWG